MGTCVVVGLLAGWLANPLPPPSQRAVDAAGWHLPDPSALDRFNATTFQKLTQTTAWKAPAGARVDSAAGNSGGKAARADDTSWTLVGIVTAAGPYALVLPGGSSETRRMRAGDQLPDGSSIERIGKDSIEVGSGTCHRTVPLYPKPGATQAKPCEPVADTPAPSAAAGATHD